MDFRCIFFSARRLFSLAPVLLVFFLPPFRLGASSPIIIRSGFFSHDRELQRIAAQYRNNKELLLRRANRYLKQSGYSLSRVLSARSTNGSVILEMDEGRLRAFHIFGGVKISHSILDSYLSFKPGDVFNRNRLRLQLKKLYGMNIFDSITYRIIPSRKTVWVKVVMRKRSYFQVDGNYTSQYGLMPYLGFVHRNLFSSQIMMDLNAECGFWDRLNYFQVSPRFLLGNYFLNFTYRNGRRFINRDDYSSEEIRILLGRNFTLSGNSRFSLAVPMEYWFFSDTLKFTDRLFLAGVRSGLILRFVRSNRRSVLEEREETLLCLEGSLMLIHKKGGYGRLTSYYKTYGRFAQNMGILFRNSTGFLGGRRTTDQLFLMGGDYQRGYTEGSYTTDLKFENTLELDYELFFNLLKAALFLDVSCFRSAPDQGRVLISYGPGLLLNLASFHVQLHYGVPFTASFLSGNFYLGLSRIID